MITSIWDFCWFWDSPCKCIQRLLKVRYDKHVCIIYASYILYMFATMRSIGTPNKESFLQLTPPLWALIPVLIKSNDCFPSSSIDESMWLCTDQGIMPWQHACTESSCLMHGWAGLQLIHLLTIYLDFHITYCYTLMVLLLRIQPKVAKVACHFLLKMYAISSKMNELFILCGTSVVHNKYYG